MHTTVYLGGIKAIGSIKFTVWTDLYILPERYQNGPRQHSGRIGRTGVQRSKLLTEDEQEQSEVQALQKSSGSTHVDHKLQQDQLALKI